MKLKVCVYTICKNEVQFVDKWMDSMSEADLIVVTDTGSEDGTVEKLKERGAVVYVDIVKPWRFDVARNLSLDHVPEDVDICVCTDLDELFEPGWRKKLEEAWLSKKPGASIPTARTGRYLYNWSLKEDGTPNIQFYYFKVHSRKGFIWKCPVHEYLQYIGKLPLETEYIEGMVLSHYPDPEKSRGSYLPLLELAVEEAPEDERMRYYLGREYMYKSQWKKSIDTLKEYLALPSAVWSDERCAAMRWIANSCYKIGDFKGAYTWYYKAIAEVPDIRDPYVEFSKMCYELKDWAMAYFLTKEALKIKDKSKTFVNMGYSWDYTPDDYCSIAAFWLGMPKESLEHAKCALQYAPDNERLKSNYNIIAAAQKSNCP